jgi:hypothetical protein
MLTEKRSKWSGDNWPNYINFGSVTSDVSDRRGVEQLQYMLLCVNCYFQCLLCISFTCLHVYRRKKWAIQPKTDWNTCISAVDGHCDPLPGRFSTWKFAQTTLLAYIYSSRVIFMIIWGSLNRSMILEWYLTTNNKGCKFPKCPV